MSNQAQQTEQVKKNEQAEEKKAPKKDSTFNKEAVKKGVIYGGVGALLMGAGAVAGFFFAKRS